MKKSRLFLATGALVLAVSAIFATKANKKFASSIKTGYSSQGQSVFAMKTIGDGAWLTVTAVGTHPAIITVATASGHILLRTQLVTAAASSTAHKLYY